jgi:transposase
MRASVEPIEIDMKDLRDLLESLRPRLGEDEYQKLKAAVDALAYVTDLVEAKGTTIQELRELLFGRTTEKTRTVLEDVGVKQAASDQERQAEAAAKPKPKGHGRNGADVFTGGEQIKVGHKDLKPGDRCPGCLKGKVYRLRDPSPLIRIVGRPPIQAKVYECENLRCNLCGEVFTAEPPEGVGLVKYDPTAGAMIALLKYGTGVPFHRLERLQQSLGIPLPASTQWQVVAEVADDIKPAHEELIRQAAQGEVLYNDDTSMKVLALNGRRMPREPGERTGVFTTGVVSTRDKRKIALFFTGPQHAGENLADVLARRATELGPPIQMCDALDRNLPKDFEVILANCSSHARRHFVKVIESFPEECRYVLEKLGEIYKNDAVTREQGMTPDERLFFHQVHSGPIMEQLQKWFTKQLVDKLVEPNSGLGRAITYFLRHWEPLTLFLRKAGTPLDNNITERALKKAIRHRKNSLFFKTLNGARVGDTFMSLIHTCELSDADPFDYLTELLSHRDELKRAPQDWMPWNYRQAIDRSASPTGPYG